MGYEGNALTKYCQDRRREDRQAAREQKARLARLESEERQKQIDRDAHFEELRLKHKQEVKLEKIRLLQKSKTTGSSELLPKLPYFDKNKRSLSFSI